jgi:hypothetical protein
MAFLRSFEKRRYIVQSGDGFDERLLGLHPGKKLVHLVGYWQSESYFADVADTIRDDLRLPSPNDMRNIEVANRIAESESVAIHVRWFNPVGAADAASVTSTYYRKAVTLMEEQLNSPHYYVFSDDPIRAAATLSLPPDRSTTVAHNALSGNAHADLWLMSRCNHFITANSTFSWWGAWLGSGPESIVLTPDLHRQGVGAWGFPGLIPSRWVKL